METDGLKAGQSGCQTPAEPVAWTGLDAVGVLVTWFMLQFVVGVFANFLGLRMDDPLVSAGLLPVPFVMLIVLTVVWVRTKGAGALSQLRGRRRPTWGDVAAGIVYGLIGAVVITSIGLGLQLLLESFGQQLPPVQEGLRELVTGPAAPIAIITVTGLAPLAEELLYRGMLFQGLQARFGFWPAAMASGIVFGLVHVELLVAVLTAVLGVYLAWLFRRRGTILAPILAHAVFNAISFVLIRMSPPLG
ncbi:MAG: lysostaphin resistance A-like protein [Egibacteraceae bacterium]